tara:strand:- start:2881 stop:2988 length:108 start_codon:yes stop_codon:yes gene_type:complete
MLRVYFLEITLKIVLTCRVFELENAPYESNLVLIN